MSRTKRSLGITLLAISMSLMLVAAPIGPIVAMTGPAGGAAETVSPVTTASASSADPDESCMLVNFLTSDCEPGDTESIATDSSQIAVQTMIYQTATSEWESQEAFSTITNNYAEDASTTASLDARHAIASAYEDGENATVADQRAQQAIADYYAERQKNLLEFKSKASAQLAHLAHISEDEDHIIERNPYPFHFEDIEDGHRGDRIMSDPTNVTVTLANGEEYTYQTIEVEAEYAYTRDSSYTYTSEDYIPYSFEHYNASNNRIEYDGWEWSPRLTVRGVYEGTDEDPDDYPDHHATVVYDLGDWYDQFNEWESQSVSMVVEYPSGFADDLYAAMDDGRLDPNEVRGAEGMVRHLGGDDEATEGQLMYALYHTLDLGNPDVNEVSEFTIEYTGHTELERPDADQVDDYENMTIDEWDLSGYVTEKELTGQLFLGDDLDRIESGETYETNVSNGSTTTIFDDETAEPTELHQGEFTVLSIKDREGNELDEADMSSPEYDSYDADEFVQQTKETNYIIENETIIHHHGSGDGEMQFAWPFDDPRDTLSSVGTYVLAGLAVVVVSVIGVAAAVRTITP